MSKYLKIFLPDCTFIVILTVFSIAKVPGLWRLARMIHQQCTFWFKVKEMKRDYPLIEAFIGSLKKENPYLNWKVIIETSSRMATRQVRGLVRRVLDGNPPGFGHSLLCALLPEGSAHREGRELERLSTLIPCCSSAVIRNDPLWKKRLDVLFREPHYSEVLIDFSPECDLEFVMSALPLISKKAREHGTAVSFRNMALNYSGVVPAENDKVLLEPVVVIDAALHMRSLFLPDQRLHLDLMAWQHKMDKLLATAKNEYLLPVTLLD
ncbi:MAG: hypothetical protein WCG51_05645 [Elusimicrobiota bacterium]